MSGAEMTLLVNLPNIERTNINNKTLQVFPKNRRRGNTFKLFVWGQYYNPDTKTRQRYYKKKKKKKKY